MNIELLFFGRLVEIVNDQKDMVLAEKSTTAELKEILLSKFPELAAYTYRIAVNQEIVSDNQELKENDVVAFMPPFAGG